ncbi:hypothetical protein AK88_01020 [Plasmodium fragile]|uniref:Serine aminopeptidase S33 domain-containing protein n=1 Tax=Plasmodium fragile TaxID=5857 RepID=A0A0D9QQL4_PLAFR|nr:uncharacterized protein AK88_01020 [Plasmodium fragile]KJP89354.1 hypothetical protein AK88_01020 [Plasmodium fragile]
MDASNKGASRVPQNRAGNKPVATRGGNRAVPQRGVKQPVAQTPASNVPSRAPTGVTRVTQNETTRVNVKESEKKISTGPERKIMDEREKARGPIAQKEPLRQAGGTNRLGDKGIKEESPNRDTKKVGGNNGIENDMCKKGTFLSRDGLELKTYAWVVKNPVGIIILVHALNSHVRFEYLKHNVIIESKEKVTLVDKNNYYIYKDSWIERLNKSGYSVYSLDLRGHGQSACVQNVKTYVNRFKDLVYDVMDYANSVYDSLCEEQKTKTNNAACGDGVNNATDMGSSGALTSDNENTRPGSQPSTDNAPSTQNNNSSDVNASTKTNQIPPFYFMGLSMGGNIVLRILELREKKKKVQLIKRLNIKGVISLAGMISLDDLKKKPEYKYFYIPVAKLAATLMPTRRLSPALKFEMFPYINDLYEFDPHCYCKSITNRLGNELLKAVDALHNDMKYMPEDVQMLFVHSTKDSACSYTGVSKFFNALKTTKKELFTIEDMDHILPLEPGNDKILKKVIDWLSKMHYV